MDLTGKISNVSFSYEGKPLVTLELNERNSALEMVDELRGLDVLNIKIDKFKKKRSLDANAYFHVLVNKIAAKTKASDDEVKRTLVCRYGTLARDESGSLIGAMIPYGQSIDAFYPYTRNYKTSYVDGKLCECYLFYKRTRDLDTLEFTQLLEGTISEAKELGIETRPEEEVTSMLGAWVN